MHYALKRQLEKLKAKGAKAAKTKAAPEPKPIALPPEPVVTKKEPSKLWKKSHGRFVCLLCDHDLGTQKGIENHIEMKHPEE